jgi:hypothetical protein
MASNRAAARMRRNMECFTCPQILDDCNLQRKCRPTGLSVHITATQWVGDITSLGNPGCVKPLAHEGRAWCTQTNQEDADRSVSSVISGGQFQRIGTPIVPNPGLV